MDWAEARWDEKKYVVGFGMAYIKGLMIIVIQILSWLVRLKNQYLFLDYAPKLQNMQYIKSWQHCIWMDNIHQLIFQLHGLW